MSIIKFTKTGTRIEGGVIIGRSPWIWISRVEEYIGERENEWARIRVC